jgi:chlorobactene glucosyltransferase
MFYYNLLITAILFVLLIICIWNLFVICKKNFLPPENLPFVSVLVPARNEEINISNVLTSLLEQEYPNYEIIVLNDSSEDRTGEIIAGLKTKYPQLRVLNGKSLEEGWTGKCFACRQLYEASKGEYIIFTDADTIHNKNSISGSVNIAMGTGADMLTLFPEMTMKTLSEKIAMPMLFFTIMLLLPMYFIDKKGFVKFSVGIGPFMMFRRSAYETIGTHESVRSAIVEDVWLGRKIKEHNLKLVAADGSDLLSVRMYRSAKDIWNGFSKNIFAGLNYSSFSLFAMILMYLLLFFVPFILFAGQLSLQFSSRDVLILTGFQVLMLYLARFLIAHRFRLGYLSAILHPLGALIVPVIAFNSWIWIKFRQGTNWKGRVYKPVK